jgi:hypothetical protein
MKTRAVVTICGGLALAALSWVTVQAFDPQPDPPTFGLISARAGEVLQLHVVCSEHGAGLVGPRACAGDLMLHDRAGNVVAQQAYRLRPGQAATLSYELARGDGAFGDGSVRVGLIPCIIPNPLGGRSLPTVELVDSESGRTLVFANPMAPRLTFIQALVPDGR